MPLMKGTLHSLKHQDGPRCKSFSNQVLREMLQALDFLSSRNIVHRDLKPANILYRNSPESGEVNFILADFGLSNHPQFARLRGGTPLYMAPEIAVDDSTQPPASNSDVWSLFVTILWMNGSLDSLRTPPSVNQQWYYELWQFLLSSAQRFDPAIKEMAVLNPVNRASAAQMLVKLFGGNNLTTDLKCIPPLREGDHFTQIMAGEIKELARLLQNGNGLFMIGT
jgi:serine/threonine protein kinase